MVAMTLNDLLREVKQHPRPREVGAMMDWLPTEQKFNLFEVAVEDELIIDVEVDGVEVYILTPAGHDRIVDEK